MPHTTQRRIADRIRALRERAGLTQDQLAKRLGLPHRQTLTSIERGERALTPAELVHAADVLGVDVETFTDPYRLVGEGEFSFRADGVRSGVLDSFEQQAGNWVATYRTLLEAESGAPSLLRTRLELTERSSFEDAHAAADDVRDLWKLGDVPAARLPEAIESELGAQVLFVDAPHGMSGAALSLPGLPVIFVNRMETRGRRHFDIAHELFHILTWGTMAPNRVESQKVGTGKGHRAERLADNFAGALLMPAEVVARAHRARGDADLSEWLNFTANSLQVTSIALAWRCVVLGYLHKSEVRALDAGRLASNGETEPDDTPLRFNRSFVTRVYDSVEAGHLSFRRAARLLSLAPSGLTDLFMEYGHEPSYEC